MARKMMSKEVTFTKIKITKIEVNEQGLPVAVVLPEETILGSVSFDKAQKMVNKKYADNITIYDMEEFSNTYVMEVEEFIKLAKLKDANEPEESEEDDSEDDSEW